MYRGRVCLAQVALSIVSHVVAILIVVHRSVVVDILRTVAVHVGISLVAVYLPSATDEFVSSRCHLRRVHTHRGAWQYCSRRQQRFDDWSTTLKLQVNVDDVHLIDEGCIAVVITCLVVGVLIHHRDNLLLGEIFYVALTAHIEGRRLRRLVTLDDEALLFVLQTTEVICIDYPASRNRCARTITAISYNCSAIIAVGY